MHVLGRHVGLPPTNIIFAIHMEILPKYRGQRIGDVIHIARYEYCRREGIKSVCFVILSYNRPSIKNVRLPGYRIAGSIELISIFGGLYKRVTPWEEIRKAIEEA
jgi:GNAT superfamily N-acetyltransferase